MNDDVYNVTIRGSGYGSTRDIVVGHVRASWLGEAQEKAKARFGKSAQAWSAAGKHGLTKVGEPLWTRGDPSSKSAKKKAQTAKVKKRVQELLRRNPDLLKRWYGRDASKSAKKKAQTAKVKKRIQELLRRNPDLLKKYYGRDVEGVGSRIRAYGKEWCACKDSGKHGHTYHRHAGGETGEAFFEGQGAGYDPRRPRRRKAKRRTRRSRR